MLAGGHGGVVVLDVLAAGAVARLALHGGVRILGVDRDDVLVALLAGVLPGVEEEWAFSSSMAAAR